MTLVQSPHWPVLIDVYFFLVGWAGGAFVLATTATLLDARRFRDVSRVGYFLALAALIPCPSILIVDLGVPVRFMNMMRTFNPASPMSMGAWALLGFSACAFLAALLTLLEDTGRASSLTVPKTVGGVVDRARPDARQPPGHRQRANAAHDARAGPADPARLRRGVRGVPAGLRLRGVAACARDLDERQLQPGVPARRHRRRLRAAAAARADRPQARLSRTHRA